MNWFVYFFVTLLFLASNSYAKEFTYYISDKSSIPLQMQDKKGQQTGIVTDVINHLKIEGISFKQEVLPFKRMIKNMASSEESWITYGSAAWPGPQSTSLSKTPIIKVKHVLLTLNSSQFHDVEDLFGKTVVVIRGFDYPGLEPYFKNGLILGFEVKTHQQAIEAVLKGRAFAFPEMAFRLKYHLETSHVNLQSISLHSISDIIPDYAINLCFSHTFPAIKRSIIENRLSEMQQTGELNNILKKYIN
ncbi:substrate-binding periplasmic protein [Pseudoalteromonas sp.]|uniref:substrate-binding periplasmic protein n=1 Tax=Pseudoalteromonas sp. TaxID=53249 RepID=UPI00356483F2